MVRQCILLSFLVLLCISLTGCPSAPQETVTVPNVVGMTQTQAAVSMYYLILNEITYESSTSPAGTIIRQDPTAGSIVNKYTDVNIVISLGSSISVPNVVGMTETEATAALTAVSLTAGTVTTATSTTVAEGDIISQDPAAGSTATIGDAVSFVVSLGSSISVPNVVGMTETEATAALTAVGLTVGTVTSATSTTVAEGDIISQDPTAGSSATTGSAVSFVVSLGTPVLTPALDWSYVPGTTTILGYAVDETSDHGFVFAGGHNSTNDLYAFKLTETGTLSWDEIYSHLSGSYPYSECWGYPARGIQKTQDGGYIILGAGHRWVNGVSDGLPGYSFLLVKTDASGNQVWSKAYAPDNPYSSGNKCVINHGYALQVTSDGGYIVAGNSYVGGHYLASILKTDSSGNTEFLKVINDNANAYGQEIHSAQQTSDGGYILCGYSSDAPHGYTALLIKLGSDGDLEWSKTYQNETDSLGAEAMTMVQTLDGGYVFGGEQINSITVDNTAKVSTYGCFIAKADTNGDLLWFKNYGHSTTLHYPTALKVTPQGDVIAGGALSNGKMAIAKFDNTDGDVVWTYSLDTLNSATANAIALTYDGGCMIVGSGISGGTIIAKVNSVYSVQ